MIRQVKFPDKTVIKSKLMSEENYDRTLWSVILISNSEKIPKYRGKIVKPVWYN